jgi:hypothetical protein
VTVLPNANDESFREFALEAIEESGRTLFLRQPVRQETRSGDDAGTVVSSPLSTHDILVDGDFLEGGTSLDLRGFPGPSISGLLVAGDTLAIAGHSAPYTVVGGPYAPLSNELSSVTIDPPLEADVADGTSATVTFSGTEHQIKGFPVKVATRMVDGVLTRAGDIAYLVSQQALDEAEIVLAEGDQVFDGPDATAPLYLVVAIDAIASGELNAAVTITGKRG